MSYRTVTVSAGQTRTVTVDSGETLANVLYDVTASGAAVEIHANGTNWTIRNIGIRGANSHRGEAIILSDRSGGTSTLENLYFADGVDHTVSHEGCGIFVHREHRGHLDIRNVNVQGMADNGVYASAPGLGAGGTVDIEGSVAANCYVSNFRMSEGSLTDCVSVNTRSGWDGRCLWAWGPGPIDVDNCEFVANGRHYSIVSGETGRESTRVDVSNSSIDTGFNGGTATKAGSRINFVSGNDTNPSQRVPDGCPTSAEAAARGDPAEETLLEDPLDPINPGSYEHTIVARNLEAEKASAVMLWFDGDHSDVTCSAGDYGASCEAIGAHEDGDYVVYSLLMGGRGEQRRKALRSNVPVAGYALGPGIDEDRDFVDFSAGPYDGAVQVEMDGELSWWYPDSLRDADQRDISTPGSTVDRMLEPLAPTDPGDYSRVMTARSLAPENACVVRVWLNTTDTGDATAVSPYGTTLENIGITTDPEANGRVMVSMAVGGPDGGDPNAPEGTQARKSVAFNHDIHRVVMGREAVRSPGLDPGANDGPAQLDLTDGDQSWISSWYPLGLSFPAGGGGGDGDFAPLDPVDPSPYDHTIVARNRGADAFEYDVWVRVPEGLTDWQEQYGSDYGEYEGTNFSPTAYDDDLNPV